MDDARQIREYWFGHLPRTSAQLEGRLQVWFGGTEDPVERSQRDAEIRVRFEPLLARAASGALDGWADSPRRRLSLILLFDQFPRQMYRGTARAFEYDGRALALALSGMQSGADGALDPIERIFFYLPLQHSEAREVQDESVAACRRLLAEAPEALKAGFGQVLAAAQEHRGVIERFGRFPHRNRALGRADTPEELEYLRREAQPYGRSA